jgi:hypothetical protein
VKVVARVLPFGSQRCCMPSAWVPREGGLGGSDPGPRWVEPEPDNAPSEDDGSYATENSDEEPLVGEPAAHVEAMLSNCLDPDERQCFDDEDEDEDEDEEAAEAAEAAEDDEGEEGEGAAVDSSSEHEEGEEGARLVLNLEVIKAGMQEFGELSEHVLNEASEPPQPLEPLTGAELAAAVSTLPARLREPARSKCPGSQLPLRPPTAPDARPIAQGCPPGSRASPLRCRSEAAAMLRRLPKVADLSV